MAKDTREKSSIIWTRTFRVHTDSGGRAGICFSRMMIGAGGGGVGG